MMTRKQLNKARSRQRYEFKANLNQRRQQRQNKVKNIYRVYNNNVGKLVAYG